LIVNAGLIGDMFRTFALPGLKRAAGVATRLMPIPQPTLLVGPGSSVRLAQSVGQCGHGKLLIVTDAEITRLGLMQPLLNTLDEQGTRYIVFDRVSADAPMPLVDAGAQRFREQGCGAVVAFGGGSVIDAAKAIALAAANHKPVARLVGYFQGLHAAAPVYAVPTTAGTGSEVSVAALVSDPQTQRKRLIVDTRIVPRMAALDANLMTGLPRHITAATGMDALTHAIEAYLGLWSTAFSDRMALAAVAMIYQNLKLAYRNGKDLAARENMALASCYAGLAFTRAGVGNVHAIAHQLGGCYHTPHGLANAIMLPHVLRFESPAVAPKLAALALTAGLGEPGEPQGELARKLIDSIVALNAALGIPQHLEALRESDIPALAVAACREADFNYPVPRIMSRPDCEQVLRKVLVPQPGTDQRAAGKTGPARRRPGARATQAEPPGGS
jgi:alcohol dehydrogenase